MKKKVTERIFTHGECVKMQMKMLSIGGGSQL
jgi:hypothetical protein